MATDPTLTEDSTTSTATEPDGPLRPAGEPVDRGVGRPIAVDPTGTFLYVAAPAPDGGFGCEGAPAEAIYVEQVDGDGSDRRLAVDPEVADATGMPLLALSDTGEVAVVPRCEGHGARVVTGTVADDGAFVAEAELTINHLDRSGPVDGITDLEFLSPGVLVAATYSVGDDGSEHRHLYSFPTGPSELTDLGPDGAIEVEVTDDGRLVVLTSGGELRVDGVLRVSDVEPGSALAVGHGRIALSTANRTDVYDVDPVDSIEVHSSPVGGWDAEVVSPRTVVFTRLDGDAAVVAFDTEVREFATLVEGGAGGMAITPDARAVFVAATTSESTTPPRLLEQRLTR